jgi:hypothetical protein
MTIENLSLVLPIVALDDDSGDYKATPYFEDYLFQLVNAMGGEGSEATPDSVQLSALHQQLIPLQGKASALEKGLANIEHPDQSMLRAKSANQSAEIEALTQLISSLLSQNASLRSALSSIKKFTLKEIESGDTAYTTTGNQKITCNNTAAATITLNTTPVDGEELILKRKAAAVNLIGTVDGDVNPVIAFKYDSPHLCFTRSTGEWSII